MVVWLASYPRSGNTFLRQVLNHVYAKPSSAVYNEETETPEALFIAGLTGARGVRGSVEELVADAGVHFVKTHALPAEDFPAIYLVRDGRDALISHAWFVLTYDRGIPEPQRVVHFEATLRDLIESKASFGGWGGNVLAWMERRVPTVVLRYENLIEAPVWVVARALESLGIDPGEPGPRPLPAFAALHASVPEFFRRGRPGGWRAEMPRHLHELFWARHGEAMRRAGYERETERGWG